MSEHGNVLRGLSVEEVASRTIETINSESPFGGILFGDVEEQDAHSRGVPIR